MKVLNDCHLFTISFSLVIVSLLLLAYSPQCYIPLKTFDSLCSSSITTPIQKQQKHFQKTQPPQQQEHQFSVIKQAQKKQDEFYINSSRGISLLFSSLPAQLPPIFHFQQQQEESNNNNEENTDDKRIQVIFCLAPGMSGSRYLFSLLESTNNVILINEEEEETTNFNSELIKTKSLELQTKGPFVIRNQVIARQQLSNFINDRDFNVVVIVLRRFFPETMVSLIAAGKGEYLIGGNILNSDGGNEIDKETSNPPLYFPPSAFDRSLRHVISTEVRAQELAKSETKIIEITLNDINTTEGVMEFLYRVGIKPSEKTNSMIGKIIPPIQVLISKSDKKKYGTCNRVMENSEAKERIFSYLVRLTSEYLIQLPQLRSPKTFRNFNHKILSVTIISDCEQEMPMLNENVISTHISDSLSHSQKAIVFNYCKELPLKNTPSFVKVYQSSSNGDQQRAILKEIIRIAINEKFTHIICNSPTTSFSMDFRTQNILQQLILSLEPNESLFVLPSFSETTETASKRKHQLVAFAISEQLFNISQIQLPLPTFESIPFSHSYLLDEGIHSHLSWYPQYTLISIR